MAGGLLVSTQQMLVSSAAPSGKELQLVDAWPSIPVLIPWRRTTLVLVFLEERIQQRDQDCEIETVFI